MIIYNITMQASPEIHDAWRLWLTEEYIPALLRTDLISHYQLTRLLEVSEEDGSTYALQLYITRIEKYKELRDTYLSSFHQEETQRWGESVFSFGTLMEVIN